MRHFFRFMQPGQKQGTADRLFEQVEKLPIYDYHCHLSPKEIWEDRPFESIGSLWLAHDHYKWRLMRQYGIEETYITGPAPMEEKFRKFAQTVALAAGNPVAHWTQMELAQYFGIQTHLSPATADEIWHTANEVIRREHLSPRKLIEMSNVRYIATTDDLTDSLEYHQKIAADHSISAMVTPSFRTDNLLLILRDDYADYLKKLSAVSGIEITNLVQLKKAVTNRLDYFCLNGCRFTDVGIPYFPRIIGSDDEADEVLQKVLNGEEVSAIEYSLFLGNLFVFLGGLYRERSLVMQLHLAVRRNANSKLLRLVGADAGGDCMGDPIPGDAIIAVLDAINVSGGLPTTILYSMNSAMCPQLATIAGSFRHVSLGAAWWMQDHKRGIAEQLNLLAENGHLATFYGMLTDSRSFTSYARHDYFRRILCEVLAGFVDNDGFPEEDAVVLAKRICFENIKHLIEQSVK